MAAEQLDTLSKAVDAPRLQPQARAAQQCHTDPLEWPRFRGSAGKQADASTSAQEGGCFSLQVLNRGSSIGWMAAEVGALVWGVSRPQVESLLLLMVQTLVKCFIFLSVYSLMCKMA